MEFLWQFLRYVQMHTGTVIIPISIGIGLRRVRNKEASGDTI